MSSLAWTYKAWSNPLPSLGSDEMYRHTLVIPNPFKVTDVDEKDGTKYFAALVLVVAPWWACRHVFSKTHRQEAREARTEARLLAAEMKTERAAE